MFYNNECHLRDLGFKKVKGFSKYMTNGIRVFNVARMKKMKLRKDGRINLTMDSGKRTSKFIKDLKVVN